MRTRIKICGITRAEDARAAVELGADAIGLVFYPASSRYVSIAQARELALAAGPFVTRVGVFLDADAAYIEEVLASIQLDMLQFHGEESETFCRRLGKPYLKAIAMGPEAEVAEVDDIEPYLARYASASGFLLDSHAPGQAGGSGLAVDFARIPESSSRPLILAGGLNVINIAHAVRRTHPYGVDVSSGVEAAGGIKDAAKIAEFIKEVKRVDCDRN
ncbi:MAG: phosphoribosylanthranilate isomerase [Gammaproteobacteria bacterium]|nr:phosphoribosylanthranilate isomerase [Gammaproteobacteria bacterium]